MARIIEFYVPERLRSRLRRSSEEGLGRILQFVAGHKGKYIWLPSGALWPMRQSIDFESVPRTRVAAKRG
jgi:hypothetical protein